MKKMKDKRGFLLGEETLKMVIAVICIGFLIYLLVAVYFNVTGEQKLKEAVASLNDKLLPEINKIISETEFSNAEVHIPNPADWIILSFVGEEEKPNSCVGQNCICICEEVFPDLFDWQINRCDKKGVCSNLANLEKFDRIKITKTGVKVLIKEMNGQIQIAK